MHSEACALAAEAGRARARAPGPAVDSKSPSWVRRVKSILQPPRPGRRRRGAASAPRARAAPATGPARATCASDVSEKSKIQIASVDRFRGLIPAPGRLGPEPAKAHMQIFSYLLLFAVAGQLITSLRVLRDQFCMV